MFCPNCGTEVKAEAVYCPHCGKKLAVFDTEVSAGKMCGQQKNRKKHFCRRKRWETSRIREPASALGCRRGGSRRSDRTGGAYPLSSNHSYG